MKSHLAPGPTGWKPRTQPPDIIPARTPAMSYYYRRFPAAMRVSAEEMLPFAALQSEAEVFQAIRYWIRPDRRRILHREPEDDDYSEPARKLRNFLITKECRHLYRWWKDPRAWRSPREFHGYHAAFTETRSAWMEPFEIAHFRLPDDISTDADVVLFQAWCQGLRLPFLVHTEYKEGYSAAVRLGIRKFLLSPWLRFAVAAPFMPTVGVLFPASDYVDSCLRMEHLVRHPYEATSGELEHIFASGSYTAAVRLARQHRPAPRKGGRGAEGYMNPPGLWYAGGSTVLGLGPNFRKGGARMTLSGSR